MAYIALYRKFRPKTFEEVVGQEHIEKTLKNQIMHDRIGHAYLFSGGRGSGKTSTAKILARAVNCLHPINGEPCNECEICKQALEGNLVDITEMDAASNNGVDNIRDIREEVEFIPTVAKYRVYIIDEVHMLSTGAFNALLKTLEEPPAHVIFILATTEPQKLPSTILSRCQRFDFRKISVEDIMKRLRYICEESGTKIEENALRMIASLADGAMRDAISILDRCVSDGDEVITEAKIRELSGVPQFEYLLGIVQALLAKEPQEVLKITEKMIQAGKDVNVFLWELIKFVRDLALCYIKEDLMAYNEEERKKMMELTKQKEQNVFLSLIAQLSELQSTMKWATQPSILFETGLVKLCLTGETQLGEALQRVSASEGASVKIGKEIEEKEDANFASKVLTNLKENGKIRIHANLLNTKIVYKEDGLVHIIFNGQVDPVTKVAFQKEETKIAIKEAVVSAFGREVSVKYDNLK